MAHPTDKVIARPCLRRLGEVPNVRPGMDRSVLPKSWSQAVLCVLGHRERQGVLLRLLEELWKIPRLCEIEAGRCEGASV